LSFPQLVVVGLDMNQPGYLSIQQGEYHELLPAEYLYVEVGSTQFNPAWFLLATIKAVRNTFPLPYKAMDIDNNTWCQFQDSRRASLKSFFELPNLDPIMKHVLSTLILGPWPLPLAVLSQVTTIADALQMLPELWR